MQLCFISMGINVTNVVTTVVALGIGLIAIGSVLAPIVVSVQEDFTATDAGGNPIYENGASWASLCGVLVIISIVALIIICVKGYDGKN